MSIVQETNRFTIRQEPGWLNRWVCQQVWIRTTTGAVELYDMPLRPFGSDR
jgi:hypothetical protein